MIKVKDIELAKKWYTEKLELPISYKQEDQKLIVLGFDSQTSLTLWEIDPESNVVPGNSPGVYPIFYTKDIETAYRSLIQKGVSVEPIQGNSGDLRWFQFLDCDGNILEICQY